jgi:hypothetical protein
MQMDPKESTVFYQADLICYESPWFAGGCFADEETVGNGYFSFGACQAASARTMNGGAD